MMIPKRIFQTAKEPIPLSVYRRLRPHIAGWKYEFFTDEQILDFFEKHPSTEFPNLIERFHAFTTGPHKADLFRYYYIWLYGGVYLDSDAMIYAPLDMITKDYSFITVKPHKFTAQGDFHTLTIFQGFLGAAPKNPAIYQALYQAYTTPIDDVNRDYGIFCRQMYQIIYEKPDPEPRTHEYFRAFKYRIYEEFYGNKMNHSVVQIDEDNFESPVLLIHFWQNKIVDDDDLKYNYEYRLSDIPRPFMNSNQEQNTTIVEHIPKIIHQLWIGPHPRPVEIMNTWKDKHPDFEYVLWDDRLIAEEFGFDPGNTESTIPATCNLTSIEAYTAMPELVGKVDILRWEILYRYGGVFIDADSICLEPITEEPFLNRPAFATFENENVRAGLIAIGTMGFVPHHPLLIDIIEQLQSTETMDMIRNYKAWYSVGPSLLTRRLDTKKYNNMITIFPSYMFLPYHFTGETYRGYKKIYAYQEWANTKDSAQILSKRPIDEILPKEFQPDFLVKLREEGRAVSVLVTCYNTCQRFLRDCFNSIRNQTYATNPIAIELIVIDDGSNPEHRNILQKELEYLIHNTRFITVIYKRIEMNLGVGEALRLGIETCTNELIAIQDSDDIMLPHRINTQYDYMMKHPQIPMCSSAIDMFRDTGGSWLQYRSQFTTKKHAPILRRGTKDEWITNHPTMMMRKSAVMRAGNYRRGEGATKYREDWDLIQRVLEIYGEIHNLQEVLGYYRLHNKQTSLNLL